MRGPGCMYSLSVCPWKFGPWGDYRDRLLFRILRGHENLLANRTEWRICAERGSLADSIDVVAQLPDDSKILVD